MDKLKATKVSELIERLSGLDPNARVYACEPPFTGVSLVPQGDGAILIAPHGPRDLKAEKASFANG